LNPAVSLSMLIQGKLSLLKFLIYVMAQIFGAFIASATIYATYFDVLTKFNNGTLTQQTASIFTTFPHPDVSWFGALFDQTFGTALLIIGILAITDKQNELSQGITLFLNYLFSFSGQICNFKFF
jgi:glycerol uptake facilitator protein